MKRRRNDFTEEEEEFRRVIDAIPPPEPPDGGWGWVIVLASFLMNLIIDGMCYSYGLLLPHLMKAFKNSSYTILCLGGALLLGTCLITGPLACASCNRFGSRKIALLGCFVSFLALVGSLASDTEDPISFVVIFGLFGGIGFGMMLLSSLLLVGFYFERRRALAATMATSGSSVGMTVIAPLTHLLLKYYEWSGTILLLTGLVIQGFVLGALLKPIDADLQKRKKLILKRIEEDKRIGPQTCIIMQTLLRDKRRQKAVSTGSLNNAYITRDNICLKPNEFEIKQHGFLYRIKAAISRSSVNLSANNHVQIVLPSTSGSTHVQHQTPSILVNGESPTGSDLTLSPSIRSRSNTSPQNLRHQVILSQASLKRHNSAKSLGAQPDQKTGQENQAMDFQSQDEMSLAESCHSTAHLQINGLLDVDRVMYRKDILYSGSVPHLPQYHDDMDEYLASITEVPQNSNANDDCWSHLPCLPKSVADVFRSLFDVQSCKSPTFILLAFSSSLTMFGYYVPFLLLPSFAHNSKADTTWLDAAYLLSILGIANTAGRIAAGILGTQKWADSIAISHIALLMAGGATLAVPFLDSYLLLAVYAMVFGICLAAFSALRSIVVVKLLGLDKLTTVYNQLYVIQGLSIIAGTPIACYLRDMTGDFNMAFYFSGACIVISGLISLPLRKISEWEKARHGILPSVDSSDDDLKKNSLKKTTMPEIYM